MKSSTSQSIDNYLAAGDGAGSLLAHARLLQKLAHIFADIAPAHLAQASTVANYRAGMVVIHAASGAVATKLRQLAPTLSQEFGKRGCECIGVIVKVQTAEIPRRTTPPAVRPLASGARREIAGLRDRLPPSPLRDALHTLLSRAADE
ncbi:DUF721 domain-containing protein [Rhodocyclus tenuis]|uniref:DUF721 domain-containing protein n=2 Tax=Rhodocyclus TaxID=1064 RepID=A0A6L5K039_RHOTE|nr:DciA family protein [Rhodocyclus gracilis]MQY52274.1 DUF721 domain-containing protein [Rhodocyclus gracilis]MRD73862.1 DUF721 domain-containing protein [Rhodocyclus gracilis]NJA89868.1 DUF721 domain-containing protein [Rhodocyclus gracilis]